MTERRPVQAWREVLTSIAAAPALLFLPACVPVGAAAQDGGAAGAVQPSARERTLEILAAVERSGGSWLGLGQSSERPLRAGEPAALELRSDRRSFLTLLAVARGGSVTLIYPSADPRAALIGSGATQIVPEAGAPFALTLWTGANEFFALATPRPIPRDWLVSGVVDADRLVTLREDQGPKLAERLQRITAGLSNAQFSAVRLDLAEDLPLPAPSGVDDGPLRGTNQDTITPFQPDILLYVDELEPSLAPFPKVPDRDELDLLGVPDPEKLD